MAAFDNLIDFAVSEEYQMFIDVAESLDEDDDSGEDEDEEILQIFKTYNHRYSKIENSDIEYAMLVAASLVSVKKNTVLTFMTQGDERVRPWHRQYEGYSAPKSSFPHWLVPPIEHMCRCYLVEDDVYDLVKADTTSRELQMPDWFNPTFKESVAFGGRIFSDEHPYFQINPQHLEALHEIANNIKDQYFNVNIPKAD